MSKIPPKKYAISLYQTLHETEKSHVPAIMKSFISLLHRNRDLSKAGRIIEAYRRYAHQQDKITAVTVISAESLHEDMKEQIIQQLKRELHQEIELTEMVDKNLLGGLVIKYGDTVIDGSLKNKIELLRTHLVN